MYSGSLRVGIGINVAGVKLFYRGGTYTLYTFNHQMVLFFE
jgi:hypothetical protein